jgi:hypothetical protein
MFPVVNQPEGLPRCAERSECQCHWQPESGAVTAPDRPTTMDAAHAVQLVKGTATVERQEPDGVAATQGKSRQRRCPLSRSPPASCTGGRVRSSDWYERVGLDRPQPVARPRPCYAVVTDLSWHTHRPRLKEVL